jgi:hypothetical protein
VRAVLASMVSRLYYLSFDTPRWGQRDRDNRMGNPKSDCTTRVSQGCIYSRQNLIPMWSPVQYLDLIAERGNFNADGASTTFRPPWILLTNSRPAPEILNQDWFSSGCMRSFPPEHNSKLVVLQPLLYASRVTHHALKY